MYVHNLLVQLISRLPKACVCVCVCAIYCVPHVVLRRCYTAYTMSSWRQLNIGIPITYKSLQKRFLMETGAFDSRDVFILCSKLGKNRTTYTCPLPPFPISLISLSYISFLYRFSATTCRYFYNKTVYQMRLVFMPVMRSEATTPIFHFRY